MEHVFQRQPLDLQLKATAEPFVYSGLRIPGKAILCYAFSLTAMAALSPKKVAVFYGGLLCFLCCHLGRGFGAVIMGCNVFFLSLMINTASL